MVQIAKKVTKVGIEIIIWLLIIISAYVIFDNPSFQSMVSNVLLLYLFLRCFFPLMIYIEIKSLNNLKSEGEKSLFIWADSLSGVENYLNFVLKDKPSLNIINNLNSIKSELLNAVNSDLKELRLLKALFKSYQENKKKHLYFKPIGAGMISVLLYLSQAYILGNIQSKTLLDFMNLENSWGLIICFLWIAVYFIFLPHSGENRMNLIYNIVDVCIEELEKEKK